MKVFLLKDVEKVGLAGEIIKVSEGYALNFLVPRKLAIEVTAGNEKGFAKRAKVVEHRHEVIESKTSMVAEKIKALTVTLKRKMHDDGKLYGSINGSEIADVLKEKGISVAKNQIEIDKSIKEKGTYEVTVKLSSKLQPKLTVHVVAER
jgi:large subunit ribosomal protein L9